MYTAYLSFKDFTQELKTELGEVDYALDRLLIQKGPIKDTVWAQDVWINCEFHKIDSIKHAQSIIKSKKKKSYSYNFHLFRRSELIQTGLAKAKPQQLHFLDQIKENKFCAWSLVENNKLLLSDTTMAKLPLGEYHFEEDKITPPSRAYLKLWELFTVHNIRPCKGDKVIDLGSSPGGWTWVLSQMGCNVISVDKAPLAKSLQNKTNIQKIKKDAFTLKPEEIGNVDWLFSDIICYPERLLELVKIWLDSGLCKQFVCTIKFQGTTDFKTMSKFLGIKGSKIIHLYHNKHEVTWLLTKV